MTGELTIVAPGRVNIIGDHTDYTGGLVLPMAIDLALTIVGTRGGDRVELTSTEEAEPAVVPLDIADPTSARPFWARYVAGVVTVNRPTTGFRGSLTSTIPPGAGLSSSAALEVGVALATGFSGSAVALAQACREAEQVASGVPCGIMDQLASAAGRGGHAMMIDCHTLDIDYVPMPSDVEVVVIFGHHRQLAGSPYAERTQQCAAAEAVIGPLRLARLDMVDSIRDPVVAMRAHHVISENQRVRDFAVAMAKGDYRLAGDLMFDSHQSLRNDFETSTPEMDSLVSSLIVERGVYGARMTGGGFGGCVVALTEPGALADGWHVKASDGAHIL
jgi:galactokinase